MLLLLGLSLSCDRSPSEEIVQHPSALTSRQWIRSEFNITSREVKSYADHSGIYVVLTIDHGDRRITAQCSSVWTTDTGEDLPSTPKLNDNCADLPMGKVLLDRMDWDSLYYFTGSGQHREEIELRVKKIVLK